MSFLCDVSKAHWLPVMPSCEDSLVQTCLLDHPEPILCCLPDATPLHVNQELGSRDFPGDPVVKNLLSKVRDVGSIPGQETKIPHAMENQA